MPESTHDSPKRKRSQTPIPAETYPLQLTTSFSKDVELNDGAHMASPRTKVARQFEDMHLDKSGISRLDLLQLSQLDDTMGDRKRLKHKNVQDREIPETPQTSTVKFAEQDLESTTPQSSVEEEHSPVIFKGVSTHSGRLSSNLKGSYPSINRLAESKSRVRKSTGTPPLARYESVQGPEKLERDEASLTWQDDEITGHNPDDPDDDGEGINGIGFKPTVAMARVRSERRRQQMHEYRTREAREARAKRHERRRGGSGASSSSKDEEESNRRVRFMEGQAQKRSQTSAAE